MAVGGPGTPTSGRIPGNFGLESYWEYDNCAWNRIEVEVGGSEGVSIPPFLCKLPRIKLDFCLISHGYPTIPNTKRKG
jgi:hypothetical protein